MSPAFAILAAEGEAQAIQHILASDGMAAVRVDLGELTDGISVNRWTGAFIGEDRLAGQRLDALKQAIAAQPPISDFPLLLLVNRDSMDDDRLEGLGQLRLVERPLEPRLVLIAARSALRSRTRQREARDVVARLDEAQMMDLRAVNERLMREAEERRSAEDRLRESEELYRYTVELSQQMAWTADPSKRLTSASPGFSVVTGVPRDVHPNDAWIAVVHPDDLASIMTDWDAVTALDEPRVAEFRMKVADGSYRLFRARAAPKLDDNGNIIRWYGYTEDIHDRRQAEIARDEAEARLRESEELYRSTLELSQQIVWTAAPDGSFLGRSRRYNELTGLDEATPPTEAIHPADVDKVRSEWRRSIASGQPFAADYRLRMKDGSYRFFRSRAAPRRDEAGNIVRWYGTSEDVQERKQAQQGRRDAEERYRLALRATNDVIWDLNPLTGQVEWSDSATLFGYVGGSGPTSLAWWEERVHPDDRERVAASLDRAVRSSRTHWSESYRFLSARGEYLDIFDRGFIIRDSAGKAVRAVGAMSDVTERRMAEAQLQRMQAELIHVSRVSAMGTMASTLAHELNQPLTAVSSYVGGSRRLLQDNRDPNVLKVREALEAAEASALRAGRIVRGLRELVARGTVAVKPEALSQLIHDASVLAFVDAHLLGVTHRVELDAATHWVDVDRIQLQQVLINLIRNSVQAMADQPVREVVISSRPARGGMVEISVADTGIGMSAEVRDALFSPFRSTKPEGMGIGLSISRTIVEAHGGKIWSEDRKGGGTVFRLTVPRAEEPSAGDLDVPAAAE